MNIFIFIPAFLVFTYALYKFVKDDYIFIRKNISSEQIFDIVFIVTGIGLFFSRSLFLVLYPPADKNIFLTFPSIQVNDFSLLGLVLGGIGGLYLIGRYKKFPINNLIDFFISAFAVALPVGYFSLMFFFKEYDLLLYFFKGVIYTIFAYYFIRHLSPKLIIFLLFFSLISLANSTLLQFLQKTTLITVENILFLLILTINLVLFFVRK